MKACFLVFWGYFYKKYVETICPNWRNHYSAAWGTGQIRIPWIEVLKTSSFMIWDFLEPLGTLICGFEYKPPYFRNSKKKSQIIFKNMIN